MFHLVNCMSSPSMGTIRTRIIASSRLQGYITVLMRWNPGNYIVSLGCISYALISIVFKYEIMIGQNRQKKVVKRRFETHYKWLLLGVLYFEVARFVVCSLFCLLLHGAFFCLCSLEVGLLKIRFGVEWSG